MWPDASHEITVPATNSVSGSLMGGKRNRSEESNSAASASASRMCEAAIENKMEMSEPHVR